MPYELDAQLWQWDARREDSWTFLAVPPDVADDILEVAEAVTRGFGSVRVEVTLGSTTWQTSLFPDAKQRTYVMPVKKAVRKAEGVEVGDTVHLRLRLVDVPDSPRPHRSGRPARDGDAGE